MNCQVVALGLPILSGRIIKKAMTCNEIQEDKLF
jgi:hypothetical protein